MNFDKYLCKIRYPERDDYWLYSVKTNDDLYDNLNFSELQHLLLRLRQLDVGYVVSKDRDFDKKAYEEIIALHNEEVHQLKTEFCEDLRKEFGGFDDDNLHQIVFDKAWTKGSGCSHETIARYYVEFYEFAKQIVIMETK